jgi:hypothetical protein
MASTIKNTKWWSQSEDLSAYSAILGVSVVIYLR